MHNALFLPSLPELRLQRYYWHPHNAIENNTMEASSVADGVVVVATRVLWRGGAHDFGVRAVMGDYERWCGGKTVLKRRRIL